MARKKSQRKKSGRKNSKASRKRAAEHGEGSRRSDAGPRPFWSGTISFGLVSVPVNLYPAVRSTRPALRMLAPDGTPLRRRYVCPAEERDVPNDELARGYEVEEGETVVLNDEELESAAPRKSRDLELARFVDVGEIDPFYFDRAYVLTPSGESTKAYRLLADVMERENKAGIATAVMRDKEYVVAILAENGVLHAETLRFADEVRGAQDVGLSEPEEADAGLVSAFGRAIRGLRKNELSRAELEDERRARLRELVERKYRRGEDLLESPELDEEAAEAGEPAGEVDLLETIRSSLSGGKAEVREDGLADLTKDELYERARDLDLPGRSRMSKDDLVRILRSRA